MALELQSVSRVVKGQVHIQPTTLTLEKLQPFFPQAKCQWTARAPLPGGNFPHDGVAALVAR